jgi:hypothetical protein
LTQAIILIVDFYLGPTAEYLNAYEILRRSFAPMLPHTSDRFLLGQDTLGRWTLVVGWLAWGLEALVIEAFLVWIGGARV